MLPPRPAVVSAPRRRPYLRLAVRPGAAPPYLQGVEEPGGGLGDLVHGPLEDLAVVRGGGAGAGDLADVLEGGGADVVRGRLVGQDGRAEGLDAAAHASSVARPTDSAPPT